MEVYRKRLAKFHEAIFEAELDTVSRLLAKGVSVNATHKNETAFTLATACIVVDQRHGYEDSERQRARELIAEAIFNDPGIDPKARSKTKRTALHEAVSMGRENWVGKLLWLGASVDKQDVQGHTPVCVAVRDDKASCLSRMILTACVDVNQRNEHGLTLLHLACRYLSSAVVRVLLKHGCAVNARSEKGENALMMVSKSWEKLDAKKLPDWLEITELLIEAGCDLNARDFQGETLLEHMVESNNVYGPCIIAERGCDAGMKDSRGLTPAQAAICHGRHELARYLIHFGSGWKIDQFHEFSGYQILSEPFSDSALISSLIKSLGQATYENIKHIEQLLYTLFESARSSLHNIDLSPLADAIENYKPRSSSIARKKRLEKIKQNLEDLTLGLSMGPLSLQHQTKIKIRAILGATNTLSKIDRLPIPTCLKRFINLGISLDKYPMSETVHLHSAIVEDRLDRVKQAMAAGGDISVSLGGHSALELALHLGSDEVVNELFQCLMLSSATSFSASHSKSDTGRQLYAEVLLSPRQLQTSTPMYFSEAEDTAVHLVARTQRPCHVEAAVKLSRQHLQVRNAQGRTCLEEAFMWRTHLCLTTAEAILLYGTVELFLPEDTVLENTTLSDMGVTLLHIASAAGALSLVGILLTSQFYAPDCTDSFGYTPLQIAESQGEVYNLLDKTTGHPQVQDLVIFVSRSQIEPAQHDMVVKMLLNHGAKR